MAALRSQWKTEVASVDARLADALAAIERQGAERQTERAQLAGLHAAVEGVKREMRAQVPRRPTPPSPPRGAAGTQLTPSFCLARRSSTSRAYRSSRRPLSLRTPEAAPQRTAVASPTRAEPRAPVRTAAHPR